MIIHGIIFNMHDVGKHFYYVELEQSLNRQHTFHLLNKIILFMTIRIVGVYISIKHRVNYINFLVFNFFLN